MGSVPSDRDRHKGKKKQESGVPLTMRCIGSMYVCGFLFWALPKCMYPKIYRPYERLLSVV